MSLKDLLIENRSAILDGWLDRALAVYPRASRDFFAKGNPFSNPIGSTLRGGMEELYEEILEPAGEGRSRPVLERVLRVRAVENLFPSQALGFLPLLKEVIREAVGPRLDAYFPEWSALSERIDRLTLQGFDVYMECREKINQLRRNERFPSSPRRKPGSGMS
jgi:RsbT co-antagonist protein rsbRD N-terminal domain